MRIHCGRTKSGYRVCVAAGLWAALCAVGCGTAKPLGEGSEAISNGEVTDGAGFAVVKVAIATPQGAAGCSGTLVKADVVLTARHCATTDFTSDGPNLQPATNFTVDLNGNKLSVLKVGELPASQDPFHLIDVVLLRLSGAYPDPFRPIWAGTQAELDGQVMSCFGYAVDNVPADCPGGGEPCLGPLRVGEFVQDHGHLSFDFGYAIEHGDSGGPCIYFQPVINPVTHISYCPIPCPSFLASAHSAVDDVNQIGIETTAPNFANWVSTTLGAGFIVKGPLEWAGFWDGIKGAFPAAGSFMPQFAGSDAAEASLLDGTSDIALLARPLRRPVLDFAARLGTPLEATAVGLEPIGLFVQRDNRLASLELATIRALYSGVDGSGSPAACASPARPLDWSRLGVPGLNAPVHAVRPDPARGDLSREFQRLVGIRAFCADVRVARGRAAAGLAVALDPDAIAFDALDASNADLNRLVAVGSGLGSSLPSADAVRRGLYPLTRPLVVVAKIQVANHEARSLADFLSAPANLSPLFPGPVFVGCAASGCGDFAAAIADAPDPFSVEESTFAPAGDTTVTATAPNSNFGTLETLGAERALVQFDDDALRVIAAGRRLEHATLELTVAEEQLRKSGHAKVALHAMQHPWDEVGATFRCSDAFVFGRIVANCPLGRAWSMSPQKPSESPFVPEPTDTETINGSQREVLRFDVTDDVRGILDHRAVFGWMTRLVGAGEVRFGSRESATPPRLILHLSPRAGEEGDDRKGGHDGRRL